MSKKILAIVALAALPTLAHADDLGAVLGGVMGGVVGNQVGRGSGNVAATIAGAVIGSQMGRNSAPFNGYGYQSYAPRYYGGATPYSVPRYYAPAPVAPVQTCVVPVWNDYLGAYENRMVPCY